MNIESDESGLREKSQDDDSMQPHKKGNRQTVESQIT